jgi:uncharacterized protein (DUF2126 family)
VTLQVALHHETRYRYDRAVRLGPQTIRLRPAPHCRTPVLSYSLRVTPEEHFVNWQQDPQGNFLARVVVPEPTRELRVVVDLVAEMSVINPFDFFLEEGAEQWPFRYEPWLAEELEPFLQAEPAGPRVLEWVGSVSREPTPAVEFLVDLNRRLENEVEYVIRLEPGVQTPEETLAWARGSCRDSAWLMVQILRRLGIAARFASGYLIQLEPDVESLDGPSGADRDVTDLHAWAEAYLPGAGWVGLDPTSGLLAGEGHLPLACSPKPQTAAPITGAVEPCQVEFGHSMSVERILESPRVTRPYAEAQWRAIDSLGQVVDARLVEGDVRLTMGGEPTFVSIDDVEGAEWSTEAVGPSKRRLAVDLVQRLRERFAPRGLLHYGQGKWYPDEAVPRFALSLVWREDGLPLWRDPGHIADEARDHAPPPELAERFARALATRLEIDPDFVVPAYEDPLATLVAEARLPENVDPCDPALDEPGERARLARVLSRGLSRPAGFVLPVRVGNAQDGRRSWRSERWSLRRGHVFLDAGDSPLGHRLPLASLPVVPPEDFPHVFDPDPSVWRPPLAAPEPRRQPFLSGEDEGQDKSSGVAGELSSSAVRTALAFEPRDGRLCVFLPPLESTDDYVDLVAAIEDTAAELDVPIHVEGHGPPPDPRLRMLQVTPDPGVLEVNVQPAASWRDLVEIHTAVYEEARLTRLGTEKFGIDGRHIGTGGGNHLVLGGATPADSPFLRRPDLLRSLVAYWLNHPSLSYLFSGLFIGPTSQAPRIDEARQDALYELEIAFRQIPEPGAGPCPPWLVDRLLRDLLVDVTGNTHRAEFCIDKLYSPDAARGRQGLLELRGFEMPPHPHMSLAQQLLVRALVARFWHEPYRAGLVRFGTSLHDRYLLPHFVWQDLQEVLAELRDVGFPFEDAWFGPHFEFRFPRYGAFRHGDIEIELRQALEPWPVLGEEVTASGASRAVDSSLERLQVRARGLSGDRYLLGCNGVRLPMRPTGTAGESVAGVRFRAWQSARGLHPTIPVQAPLTFDLVDTWSGRAVAGCRYHVAHPGGRNYETLPVNAYEAEARRLARFFPFGHTPGPARLREPPAHGDFPTTLDLRTCAR